MGIAGFFTGALKIALAMFVAVLALAAVGWGVVEYKDRNQRLTARQYETLKVWRKDLKENLQFDLSARTKLVDGRLFVALQVDGFPAYFTHPKLAAKNHNARLYITFEDQDGFKQYEKVLSFSDFSYIVDGKGKRIGFDHQFDDSLTIDRYKSFSMMTVRWTLDTDIPAEAKTAPAPRVADQGDADHCAPGLSKSDRLRRMAKHGVVRETGRDTYTVGHRELMYIGDRLFRCQ